MVSIVVCYSQTNRIPKHYANLRDTIDVEFEHITIDNTEKKFGICHAYNIAVSEAKGEFIAFVHDDVVFVNSGWGKKVINCFQNDNNIGLIGVAGTQYLFPELPLWSLAGVPFVKGQVIHQTSDSDNSYLTTFSCDPGHPEEVVVVDGLFFVIRKELFQTIRFDEETFDKYHFYDLDICMQIRNTHKLVVIYDVGIKHFSRGHFGDQWREYGHRFSKKYHNQLPASCCDTIPSIHHKNLVFPETIVDTSVTHD